MPVWYAQPAVFQNTSVEDAAKFDKLPFYLTKNEVKVFPKWNIFDQLFGTIDWEPNMGDVMRSVTPQSSPVAETFFFPKNVTELPQKHMYEVTSSKEDARVKWHRYESKQFNFLPYFNAFWRDHLKFQNSDIARQIMVSNNNFIRTNLWFKAPNIYIAGVGMVAAPTGDGNSDLNAADSKTKDWLAAQILAVKSHLSLRTLYRSQLTLREDLAAPPFDGVQNMPKDNEGFKGKYLIVGSTEAWDMFPFDTDAHLLKSINLDLLFNDFAGLLFGKCTFKYDPFPMRFKADGTPVPPQIYNADTKKSVPNPDYINLEVATHEVAWMLGADVCKTIKVGPPPKEFAAQSMSAKKFYGMRWNGEIQLTDQVLIKYDDGSVDLNTYGTQLKFQAATTHGYLPLEPRYSLPILFRRKRAAEIA